MLRRILVSTLLAAGVSLGCGGTEPQADEAVTGQQKAGLVDACSRLQGRGCGPFSELPCVFSDGTPGTCYCQDIPFNQWQCTTLD
ncbi:hypothetical protein DRW03_02525 [Corallococcus sp. H22C18031201]|uniref:hypothetical protein n=1 Tax=Citreicoccus inhibens TaxID=2849499 RepID=UPI000E761F6A|nr:hypothetical protein [Citreicoccus inhibens]MBU8895120.1 hypothetical protein [Citreicoccus inhibens]RJS27266.1 hypothetical protein DRW03_02525 [Corallococcus sp. H22C18031201]